MNRNLVDIRELLQLILLVGPEFDLQYLSRKKGGRGLASTEFCVNAAIQGLKKYTKKRQERLITVANNGNGNIRAQNITTKLESRIRKKNNWLVYFSPWCNGYRRRNWTRRHEFKSWTECISHCTNTLGKGMNSILLPPSMGK